MFFSFSGFPQAQVAIPARGVKIINIHALAESQSEITATIEQREFFLCDTLADSGWRKVKLYRWDKSYRRIEGYVKVDEAAILEWMSLKVQRSLIRKTLLKYYYCVEDHMKSASAYEKAGNRWASAKDSLRNIEYVKALSTMARMKYDPILELLPVYICRTGDSKTMQLFIDVLWMDRWSSNEAPQLAVARCYVCKPGFILEMLQKPVNHDIDKFLAAQITSGLIIHYGGDAFAEPDQTEYRELMKMLERME